MSAVPITRRHFLKVSAATGGGMIIGFCLPDALAATVQPKPWTTPPEGAEINAWLAIDKDGNVTIRVPHTEMGQGALTAVSMMIAEELNVDWTRVRAVFADPNRHLRNGNEYKSMNTSGSAVVRRQHPHIMQAGASARERLKEAAARAWGVERGRVEAKLGTLKSGLHTGTYAEFATAAAKITLPEEPAITKPGDWWLLGKPLKRLDEVAVWPRSVEVEVPLADVGLQLGESVDLVAAVLRDDVLVETLPRAGQVGFPVA